MISKNSITVPFWGTKNITLILALSCIFSSVSVQADVIYPINKAAIISGGQFDFKVEFERVINKNEAKILINGQDYEAIFSKKGLLIEQEDGAPVSSIMIKNASIKDSGVYDVSVELDGKITTVTWEIYKTPEKAVAKNVILLIADGLSVGHRTAARIISKGNTEGRSNGRLAMDDLQYAGFIGTSSTNSIAADSANTMSAYMTGHKSAVNALGVYASRAKDSLAHPKQETIAELLRRTTSRSIGVVSDAEIEDATPAASVAHTRYRADKAEIVGMFYAVQPDVILGGGSAYFLPKSIPGSKRKDDLDYIDKSRNFGELILSLEIA